MISAQVAGWYLCTIRCAINARQGQETLKAVNQPRLCSAVRCYARVSNMKTIGTVKASLGDSTPIVQRHDLKMATHYWRCRAQAGSLKVNTRPRSLDEH